MVLSKFSATELAAWWGASVATTVFIWDIYKWKAARPKLSVAAKTNKHSTLAVDIFVTNNGGKATALRAIRGRYLSKSRKEIAVTESYFKNGPTLPFTVEPGGFWSCQLAFGELTTVNEVAGGFFHLEIFEANASKPRSLFISVKKLNELGKSVTNKAFGQIGANVA